MGKHLVLAGGGHAHQTVLVNIDKYVERGHEVTLISPSPYHYYSGMGPGMLGGFYKPEEIRFHIQKTAEDRCAKVVLGKVESIDPKVRRIRLASGEQIPYDVLSCNLGSSIALEKIAPGGGEVFPVKPIESLWKLRIRLLEFKDDVDMKIGIIGGGPAGVEIAGNIRRLLDKKRQNTSITLFTGGRLLNKFHLKARKLALKSFHIRKIEVFEDTRISRYEKGLLHTEDGRDFPFDLIVLATGVRPSRVFIDSKLESDKDGALLVNSYLQSIQYPDIFGGGDCVNLHNHPLDKVGVYAVRENPILHHNLLAYLEGRELKVFRPQKYYQLIFNMGDDKAIYCRKSLVWDGKLAFRFKDSIDRKFMQKYQVSRFPQRLLDGKS
jgi:NADH dehydrogenase FAD-containing subunit